MNSSTQVISSYEMVCRKRYLRSFFSDSVSFNPTYLLTLFERDFPYLIVLDAPQPCQGACDTAHAGASLALIADWCAENLTKEWSFSTDTPYGYCVAFFCDESDAVCFHAQFSGEISMVQPANLPEGRHAVEYGRYGVPIGWRYSEDSVLRLMRLVSVWCEENVKFGLWDFGVTAAEPLSGGVENDGEYCEMAVWFTHKTDMVAFGAHLLSNPIGTEREADRIVDLGMREWPRNGGKPVPESVVAAERDWAINNSGAHNWRVATTSERVDGSDGKRFYRTQLVFPNAVIADAFRHWRPGI